MREADSIGDCVFRKFCPSQIHQRRKKVGSVDEFVINTGSDFLGPVRDQWNVDACLPCTRFTTLDLSPILHLRNDFGMGAVITVEKYDCVLQQPLGLQFFYQRANCFVHVLNHVNDVLRGFDLLSVGVPAGCVRRWHKRPVR